MHALYAVTYKVRLAGSAEVVAESPEGGLELTLSAPRPEVPRGINIALRTMKRGEKALLKLKPECELCGGGLVGLYPCPRSGPCLVSN